MREQEHHLQVALFNWARFHEEKYPILGLLFAIPNGGHRHITVAKKMKAEGVKAGVPDICLPVPTMRPKDEFGELFMIPGLFIEMKYGSNKPTKNQKRWLKSLEEQGYKTAVCYSDQEAKELIVNYLGLPLDLLK